MRGSLSPALLSPGAELPANAVYYFKVTSQEETHVFLASLFLVRTPPLHSHPSQLSTRRQADIISRSEAEAVLSKAPTASRLRTTIHRLPSLATLGGAFYSGSYLGTELLSLSPLFSASSFAVAGTPVAFGCLAVGGAMMLFSRSSRGRVGVEMQAGREAESDGGMEMVVWKGERRRVDTSLIQVLRRDELDREYAALKLGTRN